jgi:PAS domain S-box-containing protein
VSPGQPRPQSLLAAIIQSSDDAIVSKDLNGIVTSWNPGAERIFGYTQQEMIGKSILTIIPSDRRGEEDQVLAKVRAGETVDHFETVRQKKDGSLIDISLTVSPVRDETGTIVGASKIARDITVKNDWRKQSISSLFARECFRRKQTASRISSSPRSRTS